MGKHTVSLKTAQHVLWHWGDTNLGVQPGDFTILLLRLIDKADETNREKLRQAFPEESYALHALRHEAWGPGWLRSMVKRSLVPDREHAPVDLFEAAASSQPDEQVEADYWAANPKGVRSDFRKGERVKGWNNVGTIVDVRDEGRTVGVEWWGMPGVTQNVLSGDIQRVTASRLAGGQVQS